MAITKIQSESMNLADTYAFTGTVTGASENQSAFKNIIINGDMSIAQRGTSITGINTNTYSLDRWTTEGDDCTMTISQSTDVPTGQGFATSLKMDVTTANSSGDNGDLQIIGTRFEGQMLQNIKKGTSSAESLTLSFWCKMSQTGTYIVRLQDDDNNRQVSKSYTISSANTWENKTVTFPADTTGAFDNDNARSLRVQWYLDARSDWTSGTLGTTWEATSNTTNRAAGITTGWLDSTSSDFYLTGCQLEIGTSATDFEFLPYDVNLLRCERYFQWINRYQYQGYTVGFRSSHGQGGVWYKVPLRSTGTFTLKAMQIHKHSDGSNLTVTSLGRLAGSGGLVSDCVVAYTSGSASNADTGICFGSDSSSPNVGGFQIDAEL